MAFSHARQTLVRLIAPALGCVWSGALIVAGVALLASLWRSGNGAERSPVLWLALASIAAGQFLLHYLVIEGRCSERVARLGDAVQAVAAAGFVLSALCWFGSIMASSS